MLSNREDAEDLAFLIEPFYWRHTVFCGIKFPKSSPKLPMWGPKICFFWESDRSLG